MSSATADSSAKGPPDTGVARIEIHGRGLEGSQVIEREVSMSARQIDHDTDLATDPSFADRHIGPSPQELVEMLGALGLSGIDPRSRKAVSEGIEEFTRRVIPEALRADLLTEQSFRMTTFGDAMSETAALDRLKQIASDNQAWCSLIGMGYYRTLTPGVIQRNILENPGWYTQYTPYQAEIAQGRLEALLNFQTMVSDLTGLPVANASLLDEGTAAAEALTLSLGRAEIPQGAKPVFFVSAACHPQTIAVVRTRSEALGVRVQLVHERDLQLGLSKLSQNSTEKLCGVLLQYPATDGAVTDYRALIEAAHHSGALVTVATDLLALTLLTPPGDFGADIAVGSAQRFGVPPGYGGPHAAFFAVRDELKRLMPGRLVGISRDADGNSGLRLALQTREQHIRRERATSNICTAQVLLAVMASMYAVYHGPRGLSRIAMRIHQRAVQLAQVLKSHGVSVRHEYYFDTLRLGVANPAEVKRRAEERRINLRYFENGDIGVSLDEATKADELCTLVTILCGIEGTPLAEATSVAIPSALRRTSGFLSHPVFNQYHSETEFLRYLKRLEARDLSLAHSMIPLGSCTMKLNATSEMVPVTWAEFSQLHPFAPLEQARGYRELFRELEQALIEVTGFDAVSLQPNSGAQGEYAGLLAIRGYHQSRAAVQRTVCLIPRSAHGTNPASAVMAGFEVVAVECDAEGNIDRADLSAKISEHRDNLAALMVTYPSTHGVFEGHIKEVCQEIHDAGGLVYMDGANLNALVGLLRPADLGADVCHINLHKTFCIPHGGGGPGMGPIAVRDILAPFLPGHPNLPNGTKNEHAVGPVSAAPWGSASILVIPWVYMRAMGAAELRRATQVAVLNANYIAQRLHPHYPVLFRGKGGFVAHECILDLRELKRTAGIEVEDVAKRLMDYGFHAPTVSWPVAGTLMVEPTESESKQELDRFCNAMIAIRDEIRAIENGTMDRTLNPLKGAPHTARGVCADNWNRPYSREVAAFPNGLVPEYKFWPAVARIDGVYGDRNLVCTCPSDW